MNELLLVLDELLEAYQAATPHIDQGLVDRVLAIRERLLKVVAMRQGLRSMIHGQESYD